MNEKIPTKFLKLKKLIDVPRSEYIDGPSPKDLRDAKKRKSFLSMLRKAPVNVRPVANKLPTTLTFNAAVWVKVPKSSKQSISLIISYKDPCGEFAHIIDEDEISDGFSLMLTGCVTIKSKGIPEYIHISVTGLKEDQVAMVDDLFVQNVKPEVQSKKIA
ncbi:MAG: hypothetical protein ACI84K_000434 [Pseudohongiellaceae bacterium]|jgi:hypothetical protein